MDSKKDPIIDAAERVRGVLIALGLLSEPDVYVVECDCMSVHTVRLPAKVKDLIVGDGTCSNCHTPLCVFRLIDNPSHDESHVTAPNGQRMLCTRRVPVNVTKDGFADDTAAISTWEDQAEGR